MKQNRLALLVGVVSVVLILLVCVAGYQNGYRTGFRLGQLEGRQAGEDRFDKEWSESGGDPSFSAQIKDAKSRWNLKNGRPQSQVDPNRTPIVMAFSDQVCVQLKLSSGSIGASPTYCYRGGSTELTRDDSNVE